jgi:hypothetical protein
MKLGQTSNNPTAILLRLPEFILAPPLPSVKERLPRGGLSYDQIAPCSLDLNQFERALFQIALPCDCLLNPLSRVS